jgi:signal transduction histidine kinase/CheY-like chemotaxis protein
MTLSWLPVIWIDSIGSILILLLAGFCAWYAWRLVTTRQDQTFFHYLFLLTLSFIFFAFSRSFGHLVKQILIYSGKNHIWQIISPFSGAVNTASFIVIFSFGLYFHRSRKIYSELEHHKKHLQSLVSERTEKLEKTINEFSAVMDAIDYGILFMDARLKARITNRAFREIWGLPDNFIAQQPYLRELIAFNRYHNMYQVPEEEFDAYIDTCERDILKGTIPPTEMVRKDGRILQYQCVELPDGWRMLTYFDITELKNTQKRLTQSQKMEAIGLMAGGVAHDLNNILSGVVSYPDLLLMQLPEDSTLRKPLKVIQESGRRAAEVVADLLTVARGVASHRETHALNDMIIQYLSSPEGIKMLSRFPEVRIITDFTDEPTTISCSPVHIKKCLMNLLTNACESITGSGTVRIETRVRKLDDPLPGNEAMQPGKYVVTWIRDNGQGIRDVDLAHIFEPFYSKKVMGRSGTGLGLSIVWNTVQEHHGGVTVTSGNQGTCFTLYFPAEEKQSTAPNSRPELKALQGNGETIMVVDDEEQQRDIAKRLLNSLGYRVKTAASGEEAVKLARQEPVDLLILDMLMEPGLNGRETYEQILSFAPDQKAIIASGYSENEEVQKAGEMGEITFIRKPYTLDQLASAVRSMLGGPPPV